MIKSGKTLFTLSVLWSALLLGLGAWWVYLIMKLASGDSQYDSDKLIFMVQWEGGTFLVLLLASSLTLLFFYLKDNKRTKDLQAFFSSLTHELKTPLASIRLQCEVIHEKIQDLTGDHQDIDNLTNRLIQDTNRLETQMDKILQLSRMERGGNFNLVSINLIDYLNKIKKSWQRFIDFKFEFSIDKEDSYIEADQFALDLIFKNLIENTQNHGRHRVVSLKISDHQTKLKLTYNDGGKFLGDSKQLGKLFYKHNSTKGSGIGLYLIKNMLKKMQGNFNFEIDHSKNKNAIKFNLFFQKSSGVL